MPTGGFGPTTFGRPFESSKVFVSEYERLGSVTAYDATAYDAQIYMERVHRITVYETMFGVRQGVLNLLAVGLHHLFEQQQLFFLRRGLSSRREKVLLDEPLAKSVFGRVFA